MIKYKCPECNFLNDHQLIVLSMFGMTHCSHCRKYIRPILVTDEEIIEWINPDDYKLPQGKIFKTSSVNPDDISKGFMKMFNKLHPLNKGSNHKTYPMPKIMTLRGWIKEIWKW